MWRFAIQRTKESECHSATNGSACHSASATSACHFAALKKSQWLMAKKTYYEKTTKSNTFGSNCSLGIGTDSRVAGRCHQP
jgi:hypothetical protein